MPQRWRIVTHASVPPTVIPLQLQSPVEENRYLLQVEIKLVVAAESTHRTYNNKRSDVSSTLEQLEKHASIDVDSCHNSLIPTRTVRRMFLRSMVVFCQHDTFLREYIGRVPYGCELSVTYKRVNTSEYYSHQHRPT